MYQPMMVIIIEKTSSVAGSAGLLNTLFEKLFSLFLNNYYQDYQVYLIYHAK